MTYVTDQTPAELRAHMRHLKAMAGWHEPLADRLYKEILDQDQELDHLRASLPSAPSVAVEGLVLVPKEPTVAMAQAAYESCARLFTKDVHTVNAPMAVYRAFIAAAPNRPLASLQPSAAPGDGQRARTDRDQMEAELRCKGIDPDEVTCAALSAALAAPSTATAAREQDLETGGELGLIESHPNYVAGFKAGHAAGKRQAASNKAPAAPSAEQQANMFWNDADPERSADSIHEVIDREWSDGLLQIGDVIEIQRAVRLSNIKVELIPDPADEDGFDYVVMPEKVVAPNPATGESHE